MPSAEKTEVIKKWTDVVQTEKIVKNTKTEVKCEAEKLLYAKFTVGLKLFGTGQKRIIGFYWKQHFKHHCLEGAQINLTLKVLNKKAVEGLSYESQASAEIGKAQDIYDNFWGFSTTDYSEKWMNPEGSLILRLKLTFCNLPNETCPSIKEENSGFSRACSDEFKQNLASLIDNSSLSDLKIITKEKTVFFANINILCARCPVFTSMFRSEFLESNTGELKVDDVSAKTMKILLAYWYTGELLPSWKDEDIVAEFTYAAGKYQMQNVLNMLNDSLGKDFTVSDEDVELLKIVEKLSLKDAEARMLKRIVDKVSNVETGLELLEMFSLSTANVEENAFKVSEVLKSCDDYFSENDDKDARCHDVKLMVLACKLGIKNVESKLLKLIIRTVSKVSSADELFKLFKFQVERPVGTNISMDLLVRANPTQRDVEVTE